MKLITFAVPCYNSAAYMENCVQSLLPGGDRVEIILIDDGSKDETPAICDRLAAEHPEIIRVIHQPNGGHGEGVNQGLRHASGMYYTWAVEREAPMKNWADGNMTAHLYRAVGESEYADLCTWYDVEAGVSYSLGVTAADLDGFDILAVADAMAD